MAVDYSKFNAEVDVKALQEDVKNAKDSDFEAVPDGEYIVSVENMEIRPTKKGDRLMFAVKMKVLEGDCKDRLVFFNKVISGFTSEKYTSAQAIKGVITWLEKLNTDIVPEFIDYEDFANCVLDIFQEIQGNVELRIKYEDKAFNTVSILEAYDA